MSKQKINHNKIDAISIPYNYIINNINFEYIEYIF